MTSKQALWDLCFLAMGNQQYTLECKEKIEKDLKILEMLKKRMTINTDYYNSDDGCEVYEYIAYNGRTLNIENKEEFNKIKEWLEDDN